MDEELYELAYKQIKPQVSYIIKNNITDINYLNRVFDEILKIPTNKGYKLFIKLASYVETFNKRLIKEYLEKYKTIYQEIKNYK